MAETKLTEEQSLRAKKLAYEIEAHIERTWALPPDPAEHAKLREMTGELERMGVFVQWKVQVNPDATITAEVTLLLPRAPVAQA